MNRTCASCRWWDNEHGKWGTCTLSDPDNFDDGDEIPFALVVGSTRVDAVLKTLGAFGCSEHELYEDNNG